MTIRTDLPIDDLGSFSHSHALAFLYISMAFAVAVLAFAVYDLVKRGSALLIYCLLGSVFCNVAEPFWDALSGLRFKEGNIWAFTMFPDLALTDFPLWWVFTNYGATLAGALIVVAMRIWGSRGQLAAILIVPSAFAAWEMWTGWPMFAALNSDVGWLGCNAAAFLTAFISMGTLWAMYRLVTRPAHTEPVRYAAAAVAT